jgi:hypothetical protein
MNDEIARQNNDSTGKAGEDEIFYTGLFDFMVL